MIVSTITFFRYTLPRWVSRWRQKDDEADLVTRYKAVWLAKEPTTTTSWTGNWTIGFKKQPSRIKHTAEFIYKNFVVYFNKAAW